MNTPASNLLSELNALRELSLEALINQMTRALKDLVAENPAETHFVFDLAQYPQYVEGIKEHFTAAGMLVLCDRALRMTLILPRVASALLSVPKSTTRRQDLKLRYPHLQNKKMCDSLLAPQVVGKYGKKVKELHSWTPDEELAKNWRDVSQMKITTEDGRVLFHSRHIVEDAEARIQNLYSSYSFCSLDPHYQIATAYATAVRILEADTTGQKCNGDVITVGSYLTMPLQAIRLISERLNALGHYVEYGRNTHRFGAHEWFIIVHQRRSSSLDYQE